MDLFSKSIQSRSGVPDGQPCQGVKLFQVENLGEDVLQPRPINGKSPDGETCYSILVMGFEA